MSPYPVIAFGNWENSFYVGYGFKYYAQGLPMNLTRTLRARPAMIISWLSIDGKADTWAFHETKIDKIVYGDGISKDLKNILIRTRRPTCITLGPTKDQYFVKFEDGGWKANLTQGETRSLNKMRAQPPWSPIFDAALTGMIFGKGDTMLCTFPAGFSGFTDPEVVGSDLEKLLMWAVQNGEWTLERGSSLCQWNPVYYYLIFKHKLSGNVELRWNLPQKMQDKLTKVFEYADTPEGKREIEVYEETGHIPEPKSLVSKETKENIKLGMKIVKFALEITANAV